METIPLSCLSEYGYCPRRAGFRLLEQAWEENEYTAAGRVQHERVHDARIERRTDKLLIMDYPVGSDTMGLSGKCDCLEAVQDAAGVPLPFGEGLFLLYPVEYKHGVVRDEREYQMQLCAQAMCLEDMYGGRIPYGALFFIDSHRRDEVALDDTLRAEVRRAATALQEMLVHQRIPKACYSAKCKKCSMLEACSPRLPSGAIAYCQSLRQALETEAAE